MNKQFINRLYGRTYEEKIRHTYIQILNIILLIIFMICNWIMDVSSWIHAPQCATNGFMINCNNIQLYHIAWYTSIIITLYYATTLIINIDKVIIHD